MALDIVKVLVVDDQQEKLLVYRSFLESPTLQVVMATSGRQALQVVLKDDFAVILLDTRMPDLDGFQTAALARACSRCAQTPIIFITDDAHEMDARHGYALGDVDVVAGPVTQDGLRAKVDLFVRMHRLRAQVGRVLANGREHRYQELFENLPAALYMCDHEGRVELYNQAAIELWGREPIAGRDVWTGAWRCETLDGCVLTPDDGPMARAIRCDSACDEQELVITRTDGSRRRVISHPRVLRGEAGQVVGAVDMLVDITDLRASEQSRSLLAQIVDSTDDAVISKSLDGIVTWCNRGAEQLFGYTAKELIGKPGRVLIPQELWADEAALLAKIKAGKHVQHYETRRLRKDGTLVEVSISLSPVRDAAGTIIGASKIARDITERRKADQELMRHREKLEHLVQERAVELRESHDKLRQADRLASIGTLAAGLGHDMGNLLLPMRMRLDSLEQMHLPSEAREDLAALHSACEYLNRLSQGLRMLALSPSKSSGSGAVTDLARWWQESFPFLRSVLPASVSLNASFEPNLPMLAMAPQVFTQVIFNLVQNAGDAMRGHGHGAIVVAARLVESPPRIHIEVADNGPGMSQETVNRCLEPFFTTKTRSVFTGLGLALVSGAVKNAGGHLRVQSELGQGATFQLILPVVHRSSPRDVAISRPLCRACVEVGDARTKAYITTLLRAMGVEVDARSWNTMSEVEIAVLECDRVPAQLVASFLSQDHSRVVVMLGNERTMFEHQRLIRLEAAPRASDVRSALDDAIKMLHGGELAAS